MRIKLKNPKAAELRVDLIFFIGFFLSPFIILFVLSFLADMPAFMGWLRNILLLDTKPELSTLYYGLLACWAGSLFLVIWLFYKSRRQNDADPKAFSDLFFGKKGLLIYGKEQKIVYKNKKTDFHLKIQTIKTKTSNIFGKTRDKEGIFGVEVCFTDDAKQNKIETPGTLCSVYKMISAGRRFKSFSYEVQSISVGGQEPLITGLIEFYAKNNKALFFPPRATKLWLGLGAAVLVVSAVAWVFAAGYLIPGAVSAAGAVITYMAARDIILKKKNSI